MAGYYEPGENPTYTGVVDKDMYNEEDSSPNSSTNLYHRLDNPLYGATAQEESPEYATPKTMQQMANEPPTSPTAAASDNYYSTPGSQGTGVGQYSYVTRAASGSKENSQQHQYDYVTTGRRGGRVAEASGSSISDRSVDCSNSNDQTLHKFESTLYDRMQ